MATLSNGSGNWSSLCLGEEQLGLVRGSLLLFLQRWVFPLQLCLGTAGNFLNLLVLLRRGMRSKTNILLACMALTDMAFLLALTPNSLAAFSALGAKSPAFRRFYFNTKNHFVAVANWLSAASIWYAHKSFFYWTSGVKPSFRAGSF